MTATAAARSVCFDDRLEVEVCPELRELIEKDAITFGVANFFRQAVVEKMIRLGLPAYDLPQLRLAEPQAAAAISASFPADLKQRIGLSGPGEGPAMSRFLREALVERLRGRGAWIRASRYEEFVAGAAT